MTKKVLILGGSHSEIPLIKSCQKLGYFVITTGNNIDGLGHKTADKYIPCDYSDKGKILEIAKGEIGYVEKKTKAENFATIYDYTLCIQLSCYTF